MLSYLRGRRATEPVPSSDSPEGTAANGSNSDDVAQLTAKRKAIKPVEHTVALV